MATLFSTQTTNRGFFRLLALLTLCLSAATGPAIAGAADDEETIRELTGQMWLALGDHDLDAFQEIVADDWRLYTAGGSKFTAERLFSIHQENIRNFTLDPQSFQIHLRGDTAWATSEATMQGENQGEPWGGDFLITYIFQRDDGQWTCVHTHESRSND